MAKTSAEKLALSIRESDAKLDPFRKSRIDFIKEYVGPYYGSVQNMGGKSGPGPEPLNMVHSITSVLVPYLAHGLPKVEVKVKKPELNPFAIRFALTLDWMLAGMGYGDTREMLVLDALFGAGIAVCALGEGRPIEGFEDVDGHLQDAGWPYIDRVDLDDYVIDPRARRREAALFEGNRFRIPKEYAIESGLFKKGLIDAVPTMAQTIRRGDKAAEIAAKTTAGGEELVDMLELVNVWLPNERAIVTLPAYPSEAQSIGYLREVEWKGEDSGPYEHLSFAPVPNNVMGAGVIPIIFDLHVLINKMGRKMGRRADRDKTILAYDGKAEDDAAAVVGASDGEAVRVENVDRLKEVRFGGNPEDTYRYLAMLQENLSKLAGNIDLIGGLSAESNTLGQDQMLAGNASVRMASMRGRMARFEQKLIRKVAYFAWTDPLLHVNLVQRINGGVEVPVVFDADQKLGDFGEYDFDISAYSKGPETPQERYQLAERLVTQIVLPTAPMAMQMGRPLDAAKLVADMARWADIPEAETWYPANIPMAPAPVGGAPGAPGQGGADQRTQTQGAGWQPEPVEAA